MKSTSTIVLLLVLVVLPVLTKKAQHNAHPKFTTNTKSNVLYEWYCDELISVGKVCTDKLMIATLKPVVVGLLKKDA